jgi:hypothetical protein
MPHPENDTRFGSLQSFAVAAFSVARIVPDYSGSLCPSPARFSRPKAGATPEMGH